MAAGPGLTRLGWWVCLPVDTGHWAWEDAADEHAVLISGWWDGGYGKLEGRSA